MYVCVYACVYVCTGHVQGLDGARLRRRAAPAHPPGRPHEADVPSERKKTKRKKLSPHGHSAN